jgi:malate dehydrogenase (oxaloacetate-decarboxylating)(NADP+)
VIRKADALAYHSGERPGKIEVKSSKPCLDPREIRLAYLPGAGFPAAEIAASAPEAFRYTSRGNLVAAVTNGTAVPGLGNVGPLAAKPMLEGIAVLFKRLADIDVFDLELDVRDARAFAEVVRSLEPTFGGINLKDIRAPEGLAIYDDLRDTMKIPVFHESLYSSAVVATAALLNALAVADKQLDAIKVIICGAGTVGLGCARVLAALGVPREQIVMYDVLGLIHPARQDLNAYQAAFANDVRERTLEAGIRGADVFIGASTAGVLDAKMVRSMADSPLVLAMATPDPEIGYAEARAVRRDVIVGTSVARAPNAIIDLLAIPYIFRGALDVQASRITTEMNLAAARALAELAREEVPEPVRRAYGGETFTFGPEYLLPKPIDPRMLVRVSSAVARQAIADGVARHPLQLEEYEEVLTVKGGSGREMMRQIILKARKICPRVVFSEGSHETILRACRILLDEGIARPILLASEEDVFRVSESAGLDLSGVAVVDPARSPALEGHVQQYFQMRARRGVTREVAGARLADPRYFAAMMLHAGEADLMVAGINSNFAASMRIVLEVIGTEPGIKRISSHTMLMRSRETHVLADCAVNIDPDAEQLAEIALLTARAVRSLGVEPRVAMLAFSDFGSQEHAISRKVREATRLAKERLPSLAIDGELQPRTALDAPFRARHFPFALLRQDANVLVFPDLQSGFLAIHLLQMLGDAVAVGPVLTGARKPVQLLEFGSTVETVVNLTAIGAVEAFE